MSRTFHNTAHLHHRTRQLPTSELTRIFLKKWNIVVLAPSKSLIGINAKKMGSPALMGVQLRTRAKPKANLTWEIEMEKHLFTLGYWLGLICTVLALIFRFLLVFHIAAGAAVSYNSFLHGAALFFLLAIASWCRTAKS